MRAWVRPCLVIGIALGWSVMTFERCLDWRNDETLWTSAVNETPTKPRPLINLGLTRQLKEDYDGASACYFAALEGAENPHRSPYQRKFTWAVAFVNLSIMDVTRGRLDAASERIAQVRSRYPSFARGEDVELLIRAMREP